MKDELYFVAEANFRIIVDEYPNSRFFQDSIYYLAFVQYKMKKYQDALSTIKLIKDRYNYIKHMSKVWAIEGMIYYEIKDYRSAVRSLSRYLELYPVDEDAPTVALFLGLSYSQLGFIDRAIEELGKAEKLYSSSPIIEEIKYRLADIYLLSKNYKEAYYRFIEFTSSFKNSKRVGEVYYKLGKITFEFANQNPDQYTNYLSESVKWFNMAGERDENLKPFAQFNVGVAYYLLGRYGEATNTFGFVAKTYSSYIDSEVKDLVYESKYYHMKSCVFLKDYKNAFEISRELLSEKGSKVYDVLEEFRVISLSNNSVQEALEFISAFTNDYRFMLVYVSLLENFNPLSSLDMYVNLIRSTGKEISEDSVIRYLSLVISSKNYAHLISNVSYLVSVNLSEETRSFLYLTIGDANVFLGDYKSAIANYSLVKSTNYLDDAKEGIAYANFLMGNYRVAINLYNELFTKSFTQKYKSKSIYMLGLANEKQKNLQEAEKYYKELVWGDGYESRYIVLSGINLGWLYLAQSKFAQAINVANRILDLSRTNDFWYQQVLEIFAWGYDGTKEYKKSIEYFYQLAWLPNITVKQKIRYLSFVYSEYRKVGNLLEAIRVVEKEIIPLAKENNYLDDVVNGIGNIVSTYLSIEDEKNASKYVELLKREYRNIVKSQEYIYKYAEYLYSKEKYKEASQNFKFVIDNYREGDFIEESYFWGGWAFYSAGDLEMAIKVFSDYVSKFSSSKVASVLLTLGDLMVNRRDYESASKFYDRIINEFKNTPEYGEAVIRKSRIANLLISKPKEGQKSVNSQTNVNLNVTSVDQKVSPAQQAKKQEEKQSSIQDVEKSLENVIKTSDKKTASRAKYELAMIYKSQGKYNESLRILQEIVDEVFDETAAMSQFEIGEILRINGDYSRAWKEYLKVVYIYKDYKDIVVKSMYYAILCFVNLKDYDQADKLYQRMQKEFYGNRWTDDASKLLKK